MLVGVPCHRNAENSGSYTSAKAKLWELSIEAMPEIQPLAGIRKVFSMKWTTDLGNLRKYADGDNLPYWKDGTPSESIVLQNCGDCCEEHNAYRGCHSLPSAGALTRWGKVGLRLAAGSMAA